MSFATIERLILASLKALLRNKKIRLKDMLEWSTGNVKAEDGTEIVVKLKDPSVCGISVCVKKSLDKRKSSC